ncbi:hypothetical protein D9599_00390 [Roseomonas sp. KE2513]|uniref:hypothetical protein n=1 Tax=Roseomonas sp. KE2513 TaxID=2479202 RepID=UPI0018DF51A5|nr:hypothetical protein [Roseomonas sp. KE2513]MBI0534035.1 hypothetical protein [Roseomonas sp. KE2513]
MPILPNTQARPVRGDAHRLGRTEAERQAMLMNKPASRPGRFPGDGGRALPFAGSAPRKG